MSGQKLRISLLAFTFAGVFFALVRSILAPTLGTPTAYSFPEAIALPGWQLISSTPIADSGSEMPSPLAGRRYQYEWQEAAMQVEVRYLVSTTGNVQAFVQNYTSIQPTFEQPLPERSQATLRYQEETGFYELFSHQGQAYLSACINARGGSTVTSEQFTYNRNSYDLKLDRIVPWLLGQEDLRDSRCLWTHMSMPIIKNSEEDAYRTLEQAWKDWQQWWSLRFPQP